MACPGEIVKNTLHKFPAAFWMGNLFWPIANTLNFRFLGPQHRVAYVACCGLFEQRAALPSIYWPDPLRQCSLVGKWGKFSSCASLGFPMCASAGPIHVVLCRKHPRGLTQALHCLPEPPPSLDRFHSSHCPIGE